MGPRPKLWGSRWSVEQKLSHSRHAVQALTLRCRDRRRAAISSRAHESRQYCLEFRGCSVQEGTCG